MSGVGSLTAVAGPGVELRFRPVFVGATAGFCGNEGIPQIHTFDSEITHRGTFSYYSFFAGLIIKNYRLEVGELHGDNALWVTMTPKVDYSTAFAGISRRWGHVAFFEPGIKNVLPVVAHSVMATPVSGGYDFSPITVHYRLRDLFFAFSLKLGIGFN
ncbi:MAG: hypothetical protein M1469_00240 [Bacteroidetes bacterium]|nr:hypothetical protein [Bacteroidota bacterium]